MSDDRAREAKIRERFEDKIGKNFCERRPDEPDKYYRARVEVRWLEWQAAYAEGREDGLEEAAQIAEEAGVAEWHEIGFGIAAAIRSLSRRKAG